MARYDLIATYMMASQRNGTLYLGVTSDLITRAYMHQQGQTPGFAQKYGCKTLVWYERHDYMRDAIDRETQLKRWRRAWKIKLRSTIRNGSTCTQSCSSRRPASPRPPTSRVIPGVALRSNAKTRNPGDWMKR